jgi:hypothetical protein
MSAKWADIGSYFGIRWHLHQDKLIAWRSRKPTSMIGKSACAFIVICLSSD